MTAFLLCVVALISYSFGSLSTSILTSHIYFHENILNYSRDNVGITRFMKHHGWKGVAVLLIVEALKVIIPVLIGGLLMLIVDHADVGYAFALCWGRISPFSIASGASPACWPSPSAAFL